MAQTKIYPATQTQANTIINKVDAIDAKIEQPGLGSVNICVMDFINDDITIVSGGLESSKRRITT